MTSTNYQSDSALVYARRNFQIAEKLDDTRKNNRSSIRSGFDNGHIRMYKEATDLLNKININRSPDLKATTLVNSAVYGYMSDYAASPQERKYVL
jgi:hypothetical protein